MYNSVVGQIYFVWLIDVLRIQEYFQNHQNDCGEQSEEKHIMLAVTAPVFSV